ncbi:hypothetical protein C8J57DRAFT_664534 [Mycena rebaudengoi]|nr:hypothetical protein C8J57DRAFT_664534 [Mycena rebaudengoi]
MTGMKTIEASWRVKTRPCPFYQQGRCVFEQSCNFVHDVSVPSSSSSRLPELLDALRDVLDPPDTIPPDSISLVSEHGASPHIAGEGWTLVNDCSATKESLLSPVSLPDLQLARFSTVKNNDSFDSGYASEWSSPQHLPSTLNLVASPFGSPPSRLSGSRLFSRSPFTPGFISPTTDRDESPDLDSPSDVRHSVATITAKDPDEDEDDEDDAQYSTAQWNNVPDDAALQRSTFSDSDSDEEEQQDDSTAHLAYLANDNDTINTLYDVYLHSPPQSTLPPVDQIRKRVFTPPPPQSGFSPRDSSTPPSTPPVSRRSSSRQGALTSVFSTSPETSPRQPFSPMSNGGKVPFGFRSEVLSSAFPETNSPQSTTSRPPSPPSSGGKVPFGFRSESRNGRRSLGPASASALHTAFSRTVTESPVRIFCS